MQDAAIRGDFNTHPGPFKKATFAPLMRASTDNATGQSSPERLTQVTEQVHRICLMTPELHWLFGELATKLSPVIDQKHNGSIGEVLKGSPICQMADTLREQADSIEALACQMQELIAVIEL